MEHNYREYLFAHNYLVGNKSVSFKDSIYYNYALASLFGIKVEGNIFITDKQCVDDAADFIGQDVPVAFYRGFPKSVLKLSSEALILDQMIEYLDTYGLNNWDIPHYSIFEESVEREAFHEHTEIRKFKVVTEEEAVKILAQFVEDLLNTTRPLNNDQYDFISNYIKDYDYKVKNIRSKNTAIKFLINTKDLYYARFIGMNDILKVAEIIQYNDDMSKSMWHRNDHSLKKLNLKNQDRKFITSLINTICNKEYYLEAFEKTQLWNGLLHHIHYKPVNEITQKFVNDIRNGGGRSAYSYMEALMAQDAPEFAAMYIKNSKGSGEVLRRLDYFISRCDSEQQINKVLECAVSDNPIINLQLLMKYARYDGNNKDRTFTFIKNNLVKTHEEDAEEIKRRKTILDEDKVNLIENFIHSNLDRIYKNTLGKVYIENSFKNIALPLNQSTGNVGFGTVTTGSIIPIPKGKVIRCFTYWEKVNDIDLSAIGVDRDCNFVTEFSWRNYGCSTTPYMIHSGDQTAGYNGGSEYIDINVEEFKKKHPEVKYIIFNNNVYSGIDFSKCVCRAGYMLRDALSSGEVFEPKTVKTSFTINCNSTFAHLFAYDVENNCIIWLNVAKDSNARIAYSPNYKYLDKYLHALDTINVYDLFTMKATEIVDKIEDADIVVSDNLTLKLDENQIQITSHDQEKIAALMENKPV